MNKELVPNVYVCTGLGSKTKHWMVHVTVMSACFCSLELKTLDFECQDTSQMSLHSRLAFGQHALLKYPSNSQHVKWQYLRHLMPSHHLLLPKWCCVSKHEDKTARPTGGGERGRPASSTLLEFHQFPSCLRHSPADPAAAAFVSARLQASSRLHKQKHQEHHHLQIWHGDHSA